MRRDWGLVPKLLLGIVIGALVGYLWRVTSLPVLILRIPLTLSSLFSTLLSFIIPIMIVAFVVAGISNLTQNAGKLVTATLLFSYTSLLAAALMTYIVGQSIFPHFIQPITETAGEGIDAIKPLFSLQISPFFGVTEAIIFAFLVGLALSALSRVNKALTMKQLFIDFEAVITYLLSRLIIPVLPYYIFANFINLGYTGQIAEVFKVFGIILLLTFMQHFAYVLSLFGFASRFVPVGFKGMVKNQIPAYLTAFGTQSSAASIPVNLMSARDNGFNEQISEFVIPLTATVHLPGSMISVSSTLLGVMMMHGLDYSPQVMIPFYLTLGMSLVAAPGVPGGAIMTALPFMYMVGIEPEGPLASLLITLYITQDSFGTSINVSGDNAICALVDAYARRFKPATTVKLKQ